MGFILVVADPQQFEPYVRPEIYTAWGQLLAQRPEDNISVILPLASSLISPIQLNKRNQNKPHHNQHKTLAVLYHQAQKPRHRTDSVASREQSQRLVYRLKIVPLLFIKRMPRINLSLRSLRAQAVLRLMLSHPKYLRTLTSYQS